MKRYPITGLLLALLIASTVFITTSQHGIGFNTDSFAFLQGAHELRVDGLSSPSITLTKFPPLPALTLLPFNQNVDAMIWLNTLILGANVFAFSVLLHLADVQRWIALPVIGVVGLAPEMIFRHSMIMSEPLFLLLLQLAAIMLISKRYRWAVVFVALAPMQRYAGLTIVAASMLYLYIEEDGRFALVFGIVAILPLGLWVLRGMLVGAESVRTIAFHPISLEHIKQGILTLGGRFWFAPSVGLMLVLGWSNRDRLSTLSPPPTVRFSFMFCLIYSVFMIISISFADFSTPLTSRILSPVLLFGWVILAWFFSSLLHQRLYIGLFALVLFGFLIFGVQRLIQNTQNGIGLNSQLKPKHYDVLRNLPANTHIYSNQVGTVLVMHYADESLPDFPLEWLPAKYDVMSQEANPDYALAFQHIADQIDNQEAVILWFTGEAIHDEMVSVDELRTSFPFTAYDGLLLFGRVLSLED